MWLVAHCCTCSATSGSITLSWARQGALVTGVGFSEQSIALAQSISTELGIPATFVCSDIEHLPDRLSGQFEIVFSSYGMLPWLRDLQRWAEVIAHFLAPGGIFYLVDDHPVMRTLGTNEAGELTVANPYFFSEEPARIEARGSYAAPGDEQTPLRAWHIWNHSLGEILGALLGAGLRIEFLHEFPFAMRAKFPGMQRGDMAPGASANRLSSPCCSLCRRASRRERMTEFYAIRLARPDDLATLRAIERAAAAVFRITPYTYLADDDLVSAEVDLAHEYVWVVVDPDDQPIGFAIVHLLDESVHLHELDVHPDYARQGLGRRLIATVADWARARGAAALTLTTFADVPWNGPYYTRLGFRTLDLAAISPGLQAVRQGEAEAGLPMEHRICMQLDLEQQR